MKKMICVSLLSITTLAYAGWDKANIALQQANYELALKELKPLAKRGDATAQYNLGLMYEYGRAVPQNYIQAIYWYQKAAKQGFATAQFNKALLLLNLI
ncbi:MAG: tetratricopeptide repeat protein [Acinetobacter sp.]